MGKVNSNSFAISINAAPLNSSLASLPAGCVRNLGPYANTDVNFGVDITDYSGIVIDRARNRILIFGGGHDGCNETDIRSYDLTPLVWSSLYPSMPYSEMQIANCDSNYGRWISTNHPFTRHTYNMQVVVGNRLYIMTPKGMPYGINGLYEAHWGGRISWYDFGTGQWGYSTINATATPWNAAAAAVLDPLSGKILVVGTDKDASAFMAIWAYDPATDSIELARSANSIDQIIGISNALVYVPDVDRFYAIQTELTFYSTAQIWEIVFNRSDAASTTVTRLITTGTEPTANGALPVGANYPAFGWDTNNKVIGGYVQAGKFFAFNPFTKVWSSKQMKNEDGSDFSLSQAFHCLDYDPGSGCFIFLSTVDIAQSHAYRFGSL